ncbi:MAG TPA: DUF4956 domain-containing protein [Candidatus Polarisedimenticolaceae bacterium]|nr:DUF4956 domain-containing protein [Candidatus Polarisedimenticolaceae bacterium]
MAAFCLLLAAAGAPALAQQKAPAPAEQGALASPEDSSVSLTRELRAAAVRLPLAAALGAVLALRPRRRSTPVRLPVVVQTQIVLAMVGAVIMLVVGASLARAFGIVGVASLVRYRSKIDDPKDAVVMLSALAVGLAAGAGLLALAAFATLFLLIALLITESFQPQKRQFELAVKLGEKTADLRPRIETVLRRHRAAHELRSASQEEVAYLVTTPLTIDTERVSSALIDLAPEGQGSVDWKEKPKLKAS